MAVTTSMTKAIPTPGHPANPGPGQSRLIAGLILLPAMAGSDVSLHRRDSLLGAAPSAVAVARCGEARIEARRQRLPWRACRGLHPHRHHPREQRRSGAARHAWCTTKNAPHLRGVHGTTQGYSLAASAASSTASGGGVAPPSSPLMPRSSRSKTRTELAGISGLGLCSP